MIIYQLFISIFCIVVVNGVISNEYDRFKLKPESSPSLSSISDQPKSLYFQAVSQKRLYFPGSFRSKYCQCVNWTISGSCFVDNELYLKAGLRSKLFAASETNSGDIVASVLHGTGPENKLELKSNVQCEGAMKFGSVSINETIQQVMREFQETKNEAPGSILSPVAIKLPKVAADEKPTSFVEIGSLTIKHSKSMKNPPPPMRQWQSWRHDDFEKSTDGWLWSDGQPIENHVGHCGNGDMYLAIHCRPGEVTDGHMTFQNASKVFTDIPAHTQLEIQASVHFIDQWLGHTAYLIVDDEYVWLDTHDASVAEADANSLFPSVNVCGSSAWANDRLSVPVTVVLPHTAPQVQVTFGSNVQHHDNGMCVATLGVDDVQIWLKSEEKVR